MQTPQPSDRQGKRIDNLAGKREGQGSDAWSESSEGRYRGGMVFVLHVVLSQAVVGLVEMREK